MFWDNNGASVSWKIALREKFESDGQWVTINGRHIQLKDGQTVKDAIKSMNDKQSLGKDKQPSGLGKEYDKHFPKSFGKDPSGYPNVDAFQKWYDDHSRNDAFVRLDTNKQGMEMRKEFEQREVDTVKRFRGEVKDYWKKAGIKDPDAVGKALDNYSKETPAFRFGNPNALKKLDPSDLIVLDKMSRKVLGSNTKLYRGGESEQGLGRFTSFTTDKGIAKAMIIRHGGSGKVFTKSLSDFSDKKIIAIQKLGFSTFDEGEVIVSN